MVKSSEVDDMEIGIFDTVIESNNTSIPSADVTTNPGSSSWENIVKASKKDPAYAKLLEARERLARIKKMK